MKRRGFIALLGWITALFSLPFQLFAKKRPWPPEDMIISLGPSWDPVHIYPDFETDRIWFVNKSGRWSVLGKKHQLQFVGRVNDNQLPEPKGCEAMRQELHDFWKDCDCEACVKYRAAYAS